MNVPLVIADQCDTIVAAQSVKSARPRPPPLTEQELKALSHADLFRIGMERAQHRAQTQEGLVKYKNANRVHVVGQPVGYGIIRKSKGLDDVVHIKRLDEYQREQLAKVAKIMSETVRKFGFNWLLTADMLMSIMCATCLVIFHVQQTSVMMSDLVTN